MTELLFARRRAGEFARAVDGHQDALDPALAPLLDTVSSLREVPSVTMRERFRKELRDDLLRAAPRELSPRPRTHIAPPDPRAARRRRQLVAVATGLVVVGGTASVSAASQQALPGEMLYPVKRTIEDARFRMADGDGTQGRALLERSRTRLAEAEQLAASGPLTQHDVDAIRGALSDFAADAGTATGDLRQAYAASQDASQLAGVRTFANDAGTRLRDLDAALPKELAPALEDAARSVVALDDMVVATCPSCEAGLPTLDTDSMLVALPDLPANASPHRSEATQQQARQLRRQVEKEAGHAGKTADGRGQSHRDAGGRADPSGRAGGEPADAPSPLELPDLTSDEDSHARSGSAEQQDDKTSAGKQSQAKNTEPPIDLHRLLGQLSKSSSPDQQPRDDSDRDLRRLPDPLLREGGLLDRLL